jgi:cytoskeletal protein RodZ
LKQKRKSKQKNGRAQWQIVLLVLVTLMLFVGIVAFNLWTSPQLNSTHYLDVTRTAVNAQNQTVEAYVEQTQDVQHTAIAITTTAIYANLTETPEAMP